MNPRTLKRIAFLILIACLTSLDARSQSKEYAQIHTRTIPMSKSFIYVYFADAPMKEYSVSPIDANKELLKIMNQLSREGWQVFSTNVTGADQQMIIFLERKKP